MRVRFVIAAIACIVLSLSTTAATGEFTLEAKVTPAEDPGKYVCAASVLQHPGGAIVMEHEFTLAAGTSAVARSGSQPEEGVGFDRKLTCSISKDGKSATVDFVDAKLKDGKAGALSTHSRTFRVGSAD